MKNREKYAEQILDIACSRDKLAVDKNTGKPDYCSKIICGECMFCKDCSEETTINWSNSEYVEKPTLTANEKAFLELIDKRYKYMVRDAIGTLFIFSAPPCKEKEEWTYVSGICRGAIADFLDDVKFSFIKWKDEKPWAIEDLKKLEVKK